MARALIGLLMAALAAQAAPAAASDLILDASAGFIVPVEINGATLRLRVDPAASGLVVLNPAAAARARLSPEIKPPNSFLPGAFPRQSFARIGPVSLTGSTRRTPVVIAGRPAELRLIWFDRDALAGVDGIISVANLPFDRVVLRLGPPREGETVLSLQLDYGHEIGLYFPYALGERTLPIQFSLWRQDNMSTAAAGALLANSHGGGWLGDYARRTINFGVDRPVRPMALGRPIDLHGLAVGQFLVRTGDYRGGYALPSDSADPDEIVVTATGNYQSARLNLTLGSNQFARCSSLTYEGQSRRLTLSCAYNPPIAQAPDSRTAPAEAATVPRSRRGSSRPRRARLTTEIERSGSTDALRFPLN